MEFLLSINKTKEVRSKGQAHTVNYVKLNTLNTADKDLLNEIFTKKVHSVNFFDDKQIKQENYQGVLGLALDYDDGVPTIEDAKKLFKDYNYLIYTSTNHLKEKSGKPACERFRVILPFNPDLGPLFQKKSEGNAFYTWAKKMYPEADGMVFATHSKLYPNMNLNGNKFQYWVNEPGRWFEAPEDEIKEILESKFKSEIAGEDKSLGKNKGNIGWDEKIVLSDRQTITTLKDWNNKLLPGEKSSSVFCPRCNDLESDNASAMVYRSDYGSLGIFCHHCSMEASKLTGEPVKVTYWADPIEPTMFFMDSQPYQVVQKQNTVFYEKINPEFFFSSQDYKRAIKKLSHTPELRTSSENLTIERISSVLVENTTYEMDIAQDKIRVFRPAIEANIEDNEYVDKWLDGVFDDYSGFIKDWLALYCYENFNPMPVLVFFGDRSTGKSTFADAVKEIFPNEGDDWKGSVESFTQFFEKKLLVIDENFESKKEQYTTIKRVTGADRLTVNKKYKAPYSVRNNVKIILLTNEPRPMFFSKRELPDSESGNNFFVFRFSKPEKIIANIRKKLLERIGYYIRTELHERWEKWKNSGVIDYNRYSLPVPITELQKDLFMSAHTSIELESEDLAEYIIQHYRNGYIKFGQIKQVLKDLSYPGGRRLRDYIQQLQDDGIISMDGNHRSGGTGERLGYKILKKYGDL